MKRLILVLWLTLCLLPAGGRAQAADPADLCDLSEEELTDLAARDFPEWTVAESLRYLDRWQGQLIWYQEIRLYRTAENTLLQRLVWVPLDALKRGEAVPWETEDWAPLTLTPEAMSAARTAELTGSPDLPVPLLSHAGEVPESLLSGCAVSFLDEGEAWTQLISCPDCLTGAVRRADGESCVRITHWNGEAFDSVTNSRFHAGPLSINPYESGSDAVTVNNFAFDLQADGRWLFMRVTDGDPTCYAISDGFIDDAVFPYDSNDAMHYGIPAFERDLRLADLDAIPEYIMDAAALLDSSAYACVRADDTLMFDAPDGGTVARCYARLAGRVLQRKDGWVQLQIGSEEKGLTGWFAEADLAFGPETEAVRCGFPSHSEDDCEGSYLLTVLEGADPADYRDYLCYVWLIGRVPDGGWLVQLNVDTVCTAPENAFRDIGPATDYRTEAREIYDRYEQELLEDGDEAE